MTDLSLKPQNQSILGKAKWGSQGLMKIITWNVRRASAQSNVWAYLRNHSSDIMLLQEITGIPEFILQEYCVIQRPAVNKSGKPQKFSSAILSRKPIIEIALRSELDWVNKAFEFYAGNIIAGQIAISGRPFSIICFYSPAWSYPEHLIENIDVTDVKLKHNPKVWCTEILWKLLLDTKLLEAGPCIVGGDFNSSETFDYLWPGGPRGNAEIIERMNSLGLYDALRHHQGKLTPTFKNITGGKVIHQMDHVYMSFELIQSLQYCDVGSHADVFGQNLSDHLPIIAML